MLEIVTEVLVPIGYDVTALSGDRTGVEEVAATRPDLIILDLVLGSHPDQLSGWEYLRLIRSHRSLQRLPVLLCSGDVRDLRARAEELADDPLVGILEKPFTLDELHARVGAMLNGAAPDSDEAHARPLVADPN